MGRRMNFGDPHHFFNLHPERWYSRATNIAIAPLWALASFVVGVKERYWPAPDVVNV
jgi:hypothetical protein